MLTKYSYLSLADFNTISYVHCESKTRHPTRVDIAINLSIFKILSLIDW